MDPLSITASVVAVATFATNVCLAFSELRAEWTALPGRLHALNNEVADIKVVLYQVAAVIDERSCLRNPNGSQADITGLLDDARSNLNELKGIIDNLNGALTQKNAVLFRAGIWRKQQTRLQTLQDNIKRVKSSLNILLGASNSREMMRIHLSLESLSTVTAKSSENQTSFQNEFLHSFIQHQDGLRQSLGHNYSKVDERLSRVEKMLEHQSAQIQAAQSAQIGSLYSTLPPPSRRQPHRTNSKGRAQRSPVRSEGVGVRVRQYATVCQPSCPCICHSPQRSTTPRFVDRVLGQLFVGYAGLPVLNKHCDIDLCQKAQIPYISVEYWFPLGFCWSQIIQLQLAYQPNVGPRLQLSTLRRVPDSAQCVNFALEGNIEGLKNLFSHGSASPRDVSSTRGYSLLRWALYGQQYETCRFLMSVGADPEYRPISQSDDCPSDKACDIVLRGGLSGEMVDMLRCLTEGSDFIEKQNFATIHKIVLQLSMQDLEDEIIQNPDEVDVPDATGRTALEWAAARGDERAVVTLLSYSANPNTMDKKLNTPLTLAANQNQTVCARLLLEAGAFTDPPLPPGIKFGSPLNCAARNAADPLLLKTLLDFNADIEASGVDGVTPLLHVARGNSASHAMILLEYGADINATSKSGQTPLTTAISYNNHAVLEFLLDRWFQYSECPRLKGPHLLELVAQYADLETISILASADHLKLRSDKTYTLGDFATRLRQRADASEKLSLAFEELLDTMAKEPPPSNTSLEFRMESGLLKPPQVSLLHDDAIAGSDNDSEQSFEDALEDVALASDNVTCFTSIFKKRATM